MLLTLQLLHYCSRAKVITQWESHRCDDVILVVVINHLKILPHEQTLQHRRPIIIHRRISTKERSHPTNEPPNRIPNRPQTINITHEYTKPATSMTNLLE